MTLWGQCAFWHDHFLPLGTRLQTWIRILSGNVCHKFDWQFKKKKKSTRALGTGPHCLLFIYTHLRENKSHFGAEIPSGSPYRVLWMAVMNFKCFTRRADEQMVLLAEVPPNTHWHTGNEINPFCYCKKRKDKKSPIGWIELMLWDWNQCVDLPYFFPFLSSWVSLSSRSCKYLSRNVSITGSC